MQNNLGKKIKLPELLVPAGGREQFEAACIYGASAVYLGGEGFNLRKSSHGFTKKELSQAVIDAHKVGIQVYYCLNALPFNYQIKEVRERLKSLVSVPESEQVDALIIADAGVFSLAKEICPHIPIHLSTQAHTVNAESIKFWQKQGATRVNLARELNYKDIYDIVHSVPEMECEIFMHGAMCLALSGHCLLSMWTNNRVANHGACSQPCRFEYKGKEVHLHETSLHLINPDRSDDTLWIAEENEEYSTIWSPHEQCLIRYLHFFVKNNISSLKIEGRTKSPSYVAQVTDIYRTALNRIAGVFENNSENKKYFCDDLISELATVATRPLSTGFFMPNRRIEAEVQKMQSKKIVARILEQIKEDAWLVDVRAQWQDSKTAQVLVPKYQRPELKNYALENHKGEKVSVLHPGMRGVLHCESMGENKDLSLHYYIQII